MFEGIAGIGLALQIGLFLYITGLFIAIARMIKGFQRTAPKSMRVDGLRAEPSLEAWKLFLRGRVAQEQGKNEEALKLIEAALEAEPTNRHFLTARAAALGQVGRDTAALTTDIAARYSELARNLSGEKDQPGPWLQGLENLIKDSEGIKPPTRAIVW